MVTVVFPAAGASRRMKLRLGNVKNKNFLKLSEEFFDESILIHTVKEFSRSEKVTFLVVVVREDEVETVEKFLRETDGLKPWVVTVGGSERQYSIANGLKLVPDDAETVLVHDAARPFADLETIDAVIDAAEKFGGSIAAVPKKNVIKIVDKDGFVKKTLPLKTLTEVQTPQGFKKEILLRAYAKAEEDNFLGTDDASLVERIGGKIKIVESDYRNIKITTPEDIQKAEIYAGSLYR